MVIVWPINLYLCNGLTIQNSFENFLPALSPAAASIFQWRSDQTA